MVIIERIAIEDVRRAKPKKIYYAANTCWWTHNPEHLSTLPLSWGDIVSLAENMRRMSGTPHAPIEPFIERARRAGTGLPCDPRGSVLFETDKVEEFLSAAERNPSFYGRHGVRAFMAAHHLNCVLSVQEPRPWSATSWEEYNAALDRLDGLSSERQGNGYE